MYTVAVWLTVETQKEKKHKKTKQEKGKSWLGSPRAF